MPLGSIPSTAKKEKKIPSTKKKKRDHISGHARVDIVHLHKAKKIHQTTVAQEG